MRPPEQPAACVGALEDVLAVSHRPHDPQRPVGCVDAARQPLVQATRTPLPAASGRPATRDDEDERNGTAPLCMMCAPLGGHRRGVVTARRTATADAHAIRHWVAERSRHAETSVWVQDHLNTHPPASLSEALPPEAARRLSETRAVHATPQHGSWLHMAETDLRGRSRPCLARRLPARATRTAAVAAWERDRTAAPCRVDWQFTTTEARVKLKRLYPVLQPVNSGVLDH